MVIPIDVRFHYGAPYLQVQHHEHDRPILAESTLLPYEAHGTKRLVGALAMKPHEHSAFLPYSLLRTRAQEPRVHALIVH